MTDNKALKQRLMELCQAFVNQRLHVIQNTIREVHESMTSETKSSAGDKHETGRAMLQLEREKAGQQLAEIEKLNQLLSKINTTKSSEIIGLGSAVFTSNVNYFIAISSGELHLKEYSFYGISPSTPIAQLLLGKRVGEQIQFREAKFKIIKVI